MKLHLFKSVPSVFLREYNLDFNNRFFTDRIEEAKFIVFPVFYEVLFEYSSDEYSKNSISEIDCQKAIDQFHSLLNLVKSTKQFVILFYYRDPEVFFNYDQVIFFQTSGSNAQKPSNVFGLPAFGTDVLRHIGADSIIKREKQKEPSVSFQGLSAPLRLSLRDSVASLFNQSFSKYLGLSEMQIYYPKGYLLRRKAMLQLEKNKSISCAFVTNATRDTFKSNEEYKLSFVRNIINSDYGLCARGFGNYSYRLYEVLSAGRIPLFVNTDCIMPFEGLVDWNNHLLEVNERDIDSIDKILVDYHNSIHPDDFLSMQVKNRKLWEDYLTFKGFINKLPVFILNKYRNE